MVRVLVVGIQSTGGGAETVLHNLKEAVASSNPGLQVSSFSKREYDAANAAGSKLTAYLGFLREIRARARQHDFIISGVEGVPFLLCRAALLGLSKPRLIMWLHCSPIGYLKHQGAKNRFAIFGSLKMARHVICAAPAESQRLSKAGKNAVFLPNIRRNGTVEAPVAPNAVLPKLVFIGSFAPLKQPLKALETLRALASRDGTRFSLDYFGAGPLIDAIQREITGSIEEPRVTLHGFVRDPWKLIAPGSILLLPSLTEAMPMVVLEAIERGCVVIANTFDGYGFFDGHDGLFLSADFNNIDRVVDAVRKGQGWAGRELAQRAANSRAFLRKEFDNDRSIGILHEYLTSIDPNPVG